MRWNKNKDALYQILNKQIDDAQAEKIHLQFNISNVG